MSQDLNVSAVVCGITQCIEAMHKYSTESVLLSKRMIGHNFFSLCEIHSHPQTAAAECGIESLSLGLQTQQ